MNPVLGLRSKLSTNDLFFTIYSCLGLTSFEQETQKKTKTRKQTLNIKLEINSDYYFISSPIKFIWAII